MHRNRQLFTFSIVFALLIIGAGCFGVSSGFSKQEVEKPFTGVTINPDEVTPFQITGRVMEINNKPPYNIVVSEKIIRVTAYKIEGELRQTELLSRYGSPLTLGEIKKGERVVVHGVKLRDGTIIGIRISVKPK